MCFWRKIRSDSFVIYLGDNEFDSFVGILGIYNSGDEFEETDYERF